MTGKNVLLLPMSSGDDGAILKMKKLLFEMILKEYAFIIALINYKSIDVIKHIFFFFFLSYLGLANIIKCYFILISSFSFDVIFIIIFLLTLII